MHKHHYKTITRWTGNLGSGTASYRSYDRSHTVSVEHKPPILCSSDPAFRGDASKYNPEELFVASVSACHMLWFLHLCAVAGVTVLEYTDHAEGVMEETAEGSGRFKQITLKPAVNVLHSDMLGKVKALHEEAHKYCFIANSCNFPIDIVCY